MPNMNEQRVNVDRKDNVRSNRLGPMGFVLTFGVVTMLPDIVYKGARSMKEPGPSPARSWPPSGRFSAALPILSSEPMVLLLQAVAP